MNILHLSTSDAGGAGSAAYYLHQILKSSGHHSRMLVGSKTILDNDIKAMPYFSTIWPIYRKIFNSTIGKSFLDHKYFYVNHKLPFISAGSIIDNSPLVPDFIIVHWVSNFITPKIICELSYHYKAPIIWNLLDMGPLTGGCHYAFDCLGYTERCGNCPQINSGEKKDRSFKQWKDKYHYVQKTDLMVVSPTTWLANQVQKSSIFAGKRSEQILLGIDTDTFKPFNKETARSVLDIPTDSKVILFGASSLEEERKGYNYLLDALAILHNMINSNPAFFNNIFILIAGNNPYSIKCNIPFPNKELGYIHNERMLALTYQAADVYVCPSIEDSGPFMINQSISCGTPVVSFKMGVALDLVINNRTGYLAKLKDSYDLAFGIYTILNRSMSESLILSAQCRELGLAKCHPDIIADSYAKLFQSLKKQ